MPSALSSHHDDDDGCPARGSAARSWYWNRSRIAPATRHLNGRRPCLQSDSHALHHPGHLRLLRSPCPAHEGIARERAERRTDTGGTVMSLSSPFIRRPVATTLLTVAIALAGAVAF